MDDCCCPDLLAVQLPELRVLRDALPRGQHLERGQRRLALENRLRRREPVVVLPGVEDRVERQVLALQRVDQLVGQHQPELGAVGALHAEERGGVGIVEPRHLFGVEIEQQRPQLQRVGQQTEQPVGRLQAAQARRAAAPRRAWRSGSPAPAPGFASPSGAAR